MGRLPAYPCRRGRAVGTTNNFGIRIVCFDVGDTKYEGVLSEPAQIRRQTLEPPPQFQKNEGFGECALDLLSLYVFS